MGSMESPFIASCIIPFGLLTTEGLKTVVTNQWWRLDEDVKIMVKISFQQQSAGLLSAH